MSLTGDTVVVAVALRRRKLVCPLCGYVTSARRDTRRVSSRWRHLDLGRWRVEVRATLRRPDCPVHGTHVEGVPFARYRSGFTRDVEDLVAFLATKMEKTAITRLARIDWDTVGRICERVVADGLDPARLDGLVHMGVDEVSWKRQQNYLTLVADHSSGTIVWLPLRPRCPRPRTAHLRTHRTGPAARTITMIYPHPCRETQKLTLGSRHMISAGMLAAFVTDQGTGLADTVTHQFSARSLPKRTTRSGSLCAFGLVSVRCTRAAAQLSPGPAPPTGCQRRTPCGQSDDSWIDGSEVDVVTA